MCTFTVGCAKCVWVLFTLAFDAVSTFTLVFDAVPTCFTFDMVYNCENGKSVHRNYNFK